MADIAARSGSKLNLISAAIPPEIILRIIQHLPFQKGGDILRLQLVHPRLQSLLKNYEHSLTRIFMNRELPHASIDFPCFAKFGYRYLAECVKKYDIVDDVMDALVSRQNCCAVEEHNMALVNAGLLLIYRVASIEDYNTRLTFIKSLPRDPLTAIYITLHNTTLTARYHGSGWIHQRAYGRFMDANQISLRNELEFCFAEAALMLGPEFVSDLLLQPTKTGVEATLLNFYHDHGTHDWEWPGWGEGRGEFNPPRTHGPKKEPGSQRECHFTTLLKSLAESMKCSVDEIRTKIEEQTNEPDHPLSYLNLFGKAQLMEGRNWNWTKGEQSKGRRDSVQF